MEDWLESDRYKEHETFTTMEATKGTEKMRHLDLSLMRDTARRFARKEDIKSTPKERLSKEEKLSRAAIGSKKITSWLAKEDPLMEEWDDDPDLPELEEIEFIERREKEKAEKQAETRMLVEGILG